MIGELPGIEREVGKRVDDAQEMPLSGSVACVGFGTTFQTEPFHRSTSAEPLLPPEASQTVALEHDTPKCLSIRTRYGFRRR